MNFANVSGLMIPVNGVNKEVLSITDSLNRVIWQSGPDLTIPFYIENLASSSSDVVLKMNKGDYSMSRNIQTSTNKTSWTSHNMTHASSSGRTTTITIPAKSKMYFRCDCDGWSLADSTKGGTSQYINFNSISYNCKLGGNIMSLVFGSNFATQKSLAGKFTHTFYRIFYGIKDKVSSVSELILPATTLQANCYYSLFQGMTNITTAPDLPATTLAGGCYQSLFYGCTNLNYVKAMFTTTPGSSYTSSWLHNVAASGTFVKNSQATWDVSGDSGIPSGWTVVTV